MIPRRLYGTDAAEISGRVTDTSLTRFSTGLAADDLVQTTAGSGNVAGETSLRGSRPFSTILASRSPGMETLSATLLFCKSW